MSLDPASLITSLVVSSVGWVLFSYGRKQQRFPHVVTGILMMVYPYFMSSVALQLTMLPVLLLLLWVATRFGM
jgi:hypothetical protein